MIGALLDKRLTRADLLVLGVLLQSPEASSSEVAGQVGMLAPNVRRSRKRLQSFGYVGGCITGDTGCITGDTGCITGDTPSEEKEVEKEKESPPLPPSIERERGEEKERGTAFVAETPTNPTDLRGTTTPGYYWETAQAAIEAGLDAAVLETWRRDDETTWYSWCKLEQRQRLGALRAYQSEIARRPRQYRPRSWRSIREHLIGLALEQPGRERSEADRGDWIRMVETALRDSGEDSPELAAWLRNCRPIWDDDSKTWRVTPPHRDPTLERRGWSVMSYCLSGPAYSHGLEWQSEQ